MPLDQDAFQRLSLRVQELVLPHLVAIYAPIDEFRVEQVGTGVCFDIEERQFLVTARHTLFGHLDDEEPGEKAFFSSNRLWQVADLAAPHVFSSRQYDLAAIELRGDEKRHALTTHHLDEGSRRPTFITISGYLARDFRRRLSTGTLAPLPFSYSNYSVAMPRGLVGLRYPKRRNRDSKTRRLVTTPTPRGLSGGPMLDSASLVLGQVRIVGILTDKPAGKGHAFGEVSDKVLAMLTVSNERA